MTFDMTLVLTYLHKHRKRRFDSIEVLR